MAKMKVYSLGNHGFINSHVGSLLGLPKHVRQARVLAVAPSKAAAVTVLADRGFPNQSPHDQEFRQTMGTDVDALTTAGLLDRPGVWVTSMVGGSGQAVAEMLPGGMARLIGRIEGWGTSATFVPAGE